MLIYYIRHGQSENNSLFDNTGASIGRSEDPDLSPVGKSQIIYLAEFIKSEIVHRKNDRIFLYSSPMIRAAKTAYAIKKSTALPMIFHPNIFETGGVYLEQDCEYSGKPGMDIQFVENNFPEVNIPSFIAKNGWYNRSHETRSESRSRALLLSTEIRNLTSEIDILLLVAHGSFFQDFLSAMINYQVGENIWFNMNNCGVTCIHLDLNDNIQIRYLNRYDFLPSSLIT